MASDAAFWDSIAEKYAARPIKDEAAYAKTLERTRAHLRPDDRVIEFGCGTGTTAVKLAPAVGHYTATDIAANMIAIGEVKARDAHAANLTFLRGTLDDVWAEAPFDAVLAFNFLHLVDDLPAALARVRGLLDTGGLFISKTVCLSGAWLLMKPVIGVMQMMGRAPHLSFIAPAALERAIAAAGFEIVETGNYPKTINRFDVARKM